VLVVEYYKISLWGIYLAKGSPTIRLLT